jgi:4-amino-4-deoxy-L-arabinose transferase-like glycosyltransferase
VRFLDAEPGSIERQSQRLRLLLLFFFALFAIAMAAIAMRQPLAIWDESRSVNSALEMVASHQWIVTTYRMVPDHWYTKPPLYEWSVSGLLRLGVGAMLALRLPSLVAALLCVGVVYGFCMVLLRRPFAAAVSALLLMSSTLFFGPHVGITGDLDAYLSLFETVYALAIWAYVERPEGTGYGFLTLTGVAFALAVMTKGVAGALFLPGLFLFLLARPKGRAALLDLRVWGTLLLSLCVPLLYYGYRNHLDPGFAHDVMLNELGRYGEMVEGHKGGPLFYLRQLATGFVPGVFCLLLGYVSLWRFAGGEKSLPGGAWDGNRRERSRSASLLCGVVCVIFLLILSTSKTKLPYYCAPALPLLAIFGGLGVADAATVLTKPSAVAWVRRGVVVALMAIAVLLVLVRAKHVEAHRRNSEWVGYEREFKLLGEQPERPGQVVLLESALINTAGVAHYHSTAEFWVKQAAKRGVRVAIVDDVSKVPDGAWIISCDQKLEGDLRSRERAGWTIDSYEGCVLKKTTRTSADAEK